MNIFFKHLSIAIVPLLVLGAGTAVVSSIISERLTSEQISQQTNREVGLHASMFDSFISSNVSMVEAIANSPTVREGNPAVIMGYLKIEQKRLGNILEGLYLDDMMGNVLGSDGSAFNVRDRYYFPRMIRGEIVVTKLLTSKDTGRKIVLILVPIYNYASQQTGAIGATILVETLLDRINHIKMEALGFAVLLDQEGAVIAGSKRVHPDILKRISADHGSKGIIKVRFNGEEYIAHYALIGNVGWKLCFINTYSAVRDIVKPLTRMQLIILIAAFLIACVVAYRSSVQVMKPIRVLYDAHRRFGEGDTSVRVRISSNDEFGRMGESFNRMTEGLEERELEGRNMLLEKQKLQEQLYQAQKLEAIGQLAGGIAHDFNNLLTGIMGNIDLSLIDLAPGSTLYDNLVQVRKAAQSAAGLTRQLLAYSRKQLINPVTFNLNSLLANLSDMVMRLIGENIRLETQLRPDLGSTRADTSQMEQVIINLVVNARDAMPNGGTLVIKTSRVELDEEYCSMHPETIPGMYIALEITDTGTGIDPTVLPHIFEPFFTTKSKEKGTGLGLATTYGIVKQNDGHITVNTETGKGSTFTVFLPEVEEQPNAIGPLEQQGECRGGNETILVVEDEPFVKSVAVEILKKYGYRVLDASSGPDALRILAKNTVPIDLLLTDVVMPSMNGAELAKILSERFPAMKILFSSGYTDGIIDHESLLDEGVNFIQKPYQAEELGRKVRQVMDAGGACS